MPCSLPAAVATAAKASGVRSFGGVLIRSRARLISSVSAIARSAAALYALSRGFAPSRATSASGSFGAVAVLGVLRVLLAALVGGEGVRAEQRALGDGLRVLGGLDRAARRRPSSCRSARGRRRRRHGAATRPSYASSFSGTGPRPTARTTGTLRPEGAGSLVTSPSAPVAPRVSRTEASFPSNALSTASAPGATTGPLAPFATPTTRASARSVAAPAVLRVRAVTVVKSRFR